MLKKKDIVNIGDISNDDIVKVFENASKFKKKLSKEEKIKTMDGKIMATGPWLPGLKNLPDI